MLREKKHHHSRPNYVLIVDELKIKNSTSNAYSPNCHKYMTYLGHISLQGLQQSSTKLSSDTLRKRTTV